MPTHDFKPALGLHALTPLYDAFTAVVDPGKGFRYAVAAHLAAQPGERVLDVACGTGTLAIVLKQVTPDAEIVAADIDPAILRIARRKAAAAGLDVTFHEASADALPLGDVTVDRAVSTLAFHHLDGDTKRRALAEIRRVLRPGGRFVLADFGGVRVPWLRAAFNVLHGEEASAMSDHVAGRMPAMLEEAGFEGVATRLVLCGMVHVVVATRA